MPRRELSRPKQIVDWLEEWGKALAEPASMILIGSAALLWHAADRGLDTPLPENSMDVDPVTDSDALARARAEGSSLRAVVREIPPVFGSFFNDLGQGRAASSPASPGCCSS